MSNLVLHNLPPKAAEVLRSKSAQLERLREAGKEQVEDAVNTAEIAGTSLLVGAFQGRYPDKAKIEGVPVGAVVSVFAYLTSIFAGKSYSTHLRAVGKGALAAAAFEIGKEVGADRRAKAEGTAPRIGGVIYDFPRAAAYR